MSAPFHIFNQGSLVPNAVTGVSVSVDNTANNVKATWTAPTTGRFPYGFKVMFSNATTSGGTYSSFEETTSGAAQTTTLTAATTPVFSNWYTVGVYSSNIQNRLSPVTNGAAVQFGLAAKAASLGTIATQPDGSIDVNWTSNVSLAQPTQQVVVRFYNAAASYDDNTNAIALTGANYNTGTAGNVNGLAQLTFNTAYTIYVLTSNTINNTTYTSSAASSAITFGSTAIAATPGTINTLSDGSIDVNWTSNVTTARPTQSLRVLFTTAAGYYDYTDLIALSGTTYNTDTSGNASGLVQLAFNTAYTISILTSNAINSSFTQSTTSTATFGAVAFAAGGITNAATQSDGSITVSWTAYSGTTARPNGNTYISVNSGQSSGLGASASNYNTGTGGNGSSIPQLTFNTTYTFSILTSNALNGGTPTSVSAGSAKFGAVPNPPASISATAGTGTLAVTITAPTTVTTARPVSGYIFTLSGTSSASQTQAGLSYTFTSLVTGTYTVSVVAYNGIGNSSAVSQASISVVTVGEPTNVGLIFNTTLSANFFNQIYINSTFTFVTGNTTYDVATISWTAGTNNTLVDIYVDGSIHRSNILAALGSYQVYAVYGQQHSVYLIGKDSSYNSSAATTTFNWNLYTANTTWTNTAGKLFTVTLFGGRAGTATDTTGNGSYLVVRSPIITNALTWYIALNLGGGVSSGGGRNGGGYTAISTDAGIQTKSSYSATNTVIAGGGGGSGANTSGGNGGGSTGGSGGDTYSGGHSGGDFLAGGDGGTQSAGGAGGTGSGFLQGGADSGNHSGDGGGGGGGYYGGGGGRTYDKKYHYDYWDGWNNTVSRIGEGEWWGGTGGGGGSDYVPSAYTSITATQGGNTLYAARLAVCWPS